MLLAGAVADASSLRTAFAHVARAGEGPARPPWWSAARRRASIRREVDSDAAALMVGGLLLGLSVQWLVDPETDLDAIRRTSLETLKLAFATPRKRP